MVLPSHCPLHCRNTLRRASSDQRSHRIQVALGLGTVLGLASALKVQHMGVHQHADGLNSQLQRLIQLRSSSA
jgi:hypothetical protein